MPLAVGVAKRMPGVRARGQPQAQLSYDLHRQADTQIRCAGTPCWRPPGGTRQSCETTSPLRNVSHRQSARLARTGQEPFNRTSLPRTVQAWIFLRGSL